MPGERVLNRITRSEHRLHPDDDRHLWIIAELQNPGLIFPEPPASRRFSSRSTSFAVLPNQQPSACFSSSWVSV